MYTVRQIFTPYDTSVFINMSQCLICFIWMFLLARCIQRVNADAWQHRPWCFAFVKNILYNVCILLPQYHCAKYNLFACLVSALCSLLSSILFFRTSVLFDSVKFYFLFIFICWGFLFSVCNNLGRLLSAFVLIN